LEITDQEVFIHAHQDAGIPESGFPRRARRNEVLGVDSRCDFIVADGVEGDVM